MDPARDQEGDRHFRAKSGLRSKGGFYEFREFELPFRAAGIESSHGDLD